MGRRNKGRPVNGILVLDKPLGVSSNRALQTAKHLYFAAKAGHTGSLDPLATGVLPLCFGEATKFSQYLLDADKTYLSTFQLGATTATGDSEGEVVAEQDASFVTEAMVAEAIGPFRGPIEQIPPMYSALKHQGQPLYKLARAGQEVERKARAVTIYEYELLAFRPGPRPQVDVKIACSKGTYIRSLAEDLGAALACGGHVSALRRIQAGPFGIEDAYTMTALEQLKEEDAYTNMDALLLPSDAALGALPMVRLTESGGFYIRQGQPVQVPLAPVSGLVRVGLETGEFLGVGEILDDGRVAPRRLIVSQ
ncbi:tRNA pseudouridine(55) synthase TruB [Halieaceae bacterium IMCC14734]|uniref:tRNA pseudouridine synthase B n=1 Tax=Candidatus Litorirhabdus singularis TaxID=2518993 RepID=A0ABT3TL44_9GAMM|nr:tRNA pseudouridine(55) synthase TruB [Candidatus Litorirhabdus singularis]MCX2983051.1 tRNA pseudouridine(55) synthase TruB [Candidatus Litorirhabdus singularis]